MIGKKKITVDDLFDIDIPPGLVLLPGASPDVVEDARRAGITVITEEDYLKQLEEKLKLADAETIRKALRLWEEDYRDGFAEPPPPIMREYLKIKEREERERKAGKELTG